jgi:hypothetical protein
VAWVRVYAAMVLPVVRYVQYTLTQGAVCCKHAIACARDELLRREANTCNTKARNRNMWDFVAYLVSRQAQFEAGSAESKFLEAAQAAIRETRTKKEAVKLLVAALTEYSAAKARRSPRPWLALRS